VQPHGVAGEHALVVQHETYAKPLRVHSRTRGLDGLLDHPRQLHGLHVERELAGDETGYVEEIFDELRLVHGVALDGLERTLVALGGDGPATEQPRPAEHRVERVTELVADDREELVLRAIAPFGLLARRLLAGQEAHALVDVGIGAEPAHDGPVCIAQRANPGQEPAEDAVLAAEGKFHLQWGAGRERATPAGDDRVDHRRVVDRLPAPALHLLERRAGVFVPALVVVIDVAVRKCRPRELGHVVHDRLEELLRFRELARRKDLAGHVEPGDEHSIDHAAAVA